MSSTYGESLKLSIFGQSHGAAIGMVLDGIPAGLPVDISRLQSFLEHRAPGRNDLSTPRKEADTPELLSGIIDGYTCGAPIAAIIYNKNSHSNDYSNLQNTPRPGHADYTAHIKYGGYQDAAGGGHFSGRLTAPLCIAGGLCLQWLEKAGIQIKAHIYRIHGIDDVPFNSIDPRGQTVCETFPVIDSKAGEKMRQAIQKAREAGDSVGGTIECAITGLSAGLGEPMFSGIESRIAQIVYGIPGVKALEFGIGAAVSDLHGSENNDAFAVKNGRIVTKTNRCGGILGGISTGMPVIFRCAVKPTPSISQSQRSVNMDSLEETSLQVQGRHDPCIVPRAVPVVEAAAAIAVYDLILSNTQTTGRK